MHLKDFPEKTLPNELLISLISGSVENQLLFEQVFELLKKGENQIQAERDCVKLFLRYSQFNNVLIKAIQREWFDFKDLQHYFEPYLKGIQVDGKDFVYHDQVTYFSTLYDGLLRKYTSKDEFTSRETLMLLISSISFNLQLDNRKSLVLMMRFVDMYPIVKQLYTTPSVGDVKQSWTDVLGKIYSEDEFDWYQDLETDLPINLGGMYNIFKEHINRSSNILQVLEEERKRAPNNPYIPYFKWKITDDMSCTDECLNILQNSSTKSRVEALKRIDLFQDITKNEKEVKKVKDFKFFPQLFIKLMDLESFNPGTFVLDSVILLDQVEYYSRMETHIPLIMCKFLVHFKAQRYEQALKTYQCYLYYEKELPQDLLLFMTMKAISDGSLGS